MNNVMYVRGNCPLILGAGKILGPSGWNTWILVLKIILVTPDYVTSGVMLTALS